jgi:hypothetical protein
VADTLLDRHLGTGSLAVELDGQPIELDQLGPVAIRHGRSKPDGQPEPSTVTLTTNAELIPTVGQLLTIELGPDAVAAWSTDPDASSRFVGKVTDAKVVPAPGTSSRRRRVQVTAVGPKATLGRQLVGDVPWPAELDGARVDRLLDLAQGVTVGALDTGTVQVLARDVDRQPLLKLLDDVATDAEGLVVELRDGTLTYQDADHRVAAATTLELDATQVLWPLTWSQDLQGMVNDLTIGWGASEPQAEVRLVDQASVDVHGLYQAKVATRLATSAAAEAQLLVTVARRSRPWWDVDTMALELVRGVPPELAAQLLALEVSDLLQVTGFPTDAPLQLGRLWVEGWSETITAESWTIVLAVSPYGRTGPAARWADVPADVTWADVDPALSWAGAASWDPGTVPDDRWVGTPHNLTWADVDPGLTWANGPY